LAQLDDKNVYKMRIPIQDEDDLTRFINELESIANIKTKRYKKDSKVNTK
jgi:hypothetical protein